MGGAYDCGELHLIASVSAAELRVTMDIRRPAGDIPSGADAVGDRGEVARSGDLTRSVLRGARERPPW